MTNEQESLTDDEIVALMHALDMAIDRTDAHLCDGQMVEGQRPKIEKRLQLLKDLASKFDAAADVIVTRQPGPIIV